MRVKNILLPLKKLTTISAEDTISHALQLIEKNDYLSLPVLQGKAFLGVLSRKYIYEVFFKSGEMNREAYLSKTVKEFMKTKLPVIKEDALIEEAAELLFTQNIQFLPVVDDNNQFVGIVTHKAIFKRFINILGLKDTRIVIETHDVKGRLAKLAETIAKADGNITSIVQVDTEVMDIRELVLRVRTNDPNRVMRKLQEQGFTVRELDNERMEK